jgi:hypothetical protein
MGFPSLRIVGFTGASLRAALYRQQGRSAPGWWVLGRVLAALATSVSSAAFIRHHSE